MGRRLYERFELVHDPGETVQRRLRAQELTMRPRRISEHRRARGHVADVAGLYEQPRAASDREMIRDAYLAGDDHIVLHLHAASDASLRHDETAGADPNVAPELHVAAETGVRADGYRLLPRRPPADRGRRMDTRFPDGLRIQDGKHDQQRRVRLGDDDARFGPAGRGFELRRNEHDGRAGALKVG